MITTCTNCQARYQLENEKIPARTIKVRCPGCQGVFALDGTLAQVEETPAPPVMEFETTAAFESPVIPEVAPPVKVTPEPVAIEQPAAVVEPESASPFTVESTPTPVPAAEPVSVAAAVATLDEPAPATGSTRRRRCKEEMMARALVSDILVYNRETRDTGLEEGNLLEALGGEIKKSWELYKEKVTPEVANSTTYFREALNEILADGEQIF